MNCPSCGVEIPEDEIDTHQCEVESTNTIAGNQTASGPSSQPDQIAEPSNTQHTLLSPKAQTFVFSPPAYMSKKTLFIILTVIIIHGILIFSFMAFILFKTYTTIHTLPKSSQTQDSTQVKINPDTRQRATLAINDLLEDHSPGDQHSLSLDGRCS